MMIIRSSQTRADAAAVPGFLMPIRCRCRPRWCSLMISWPIAFLQGALFAHGFISGSRVRSGYRRTWPPSPALARVF